MDCLQDLCACIFAQAVPTFDILFMIAMLNALECEADHRHSKMTSHYISNTTTASALLAELSKKLSTKLVKREHPKQP